jgi:fatty acid amide hydrolase
MGPSHSRDLRARAAARRAATLAELAAPFPGEPPRAPAPAFVADAAEEAADATVAAATASELARRLAAGETTSALIVAALARRLRRVAGPNGLNAVAETTFERAARDAAASDARRAAGATLGPLDGIPVSVKDCIDVAGCDSTFGLAARCGRPAARDARVVEQLAALQGVVVLVRGNVPPCLMVPETDNGVHGRTLNPYSALRSPGGSSGGEAALVASGCVPLAIGTDIAGSLRGPAHLTGIFSFKPTPARVARRGCAAPRPGGYDGQFAVIAPTAGPMARCVDDLAAVLRAWWRPEAFAGDVGGVARMPFDEAVFSGVCGGSATTATPRPLRFGLIRRDGFFEPAPACLRAVEESGVALRAAGHEVVELSAAALGGVDLARVTVLLYALMGADGGLREFRRGMEGEPLHPLYKGLAFLSSIPDLLRPLIGAFLRGVLGWGRAADLLTAARARSTVEYWALVAERDALRDRLLAAWRAERIDCLLTVGFGVAAFGHGQSENLHPGAAACFFSNVLALPAGAVPVTRVRAGDEETYKCPREQRDLFAAAAVDATRGSAGMPVGVQVIAPPFEDELALRGMKELERALAAASAGVGGSCPEGVLRATLEEAANAKAARRR